MAMVWPVWLEADIILLEETDEVTLCKSKHYLV
jgi:hypothetical protein